MQYLLIAVHGRGRLKSAGRIQRQPLKRKSGLQKAGGGPPVNMRVGCKYFLGYGSLMYQFYFDIFCFVLYVIFVNIYVSIHKKYDVTINISHHINCLLINNYDIWFSFTGAFAYSCRNYQWTWRCHWYVYKQKCGIEDSEKKSLLWVKKQKLKFGKSFTF